MTQPFQSDVAMVIFTLSWFDAHKRMSKLREMWCVLNLQSRIDLSGSSAESLSKMCIFLCFLRNLDEQSE